MVVEIVYYESDHGGADPVEIVVYVCDDEEGVVGNQAPIFTDQVDELGVAEVSIPSVDWGHSGGPFLVL